MASCFCWAVNRRLVLVGLVIDGQSEGHGVTPIDLSTKTGQPHSEAKRLKELEQENNRLKRLLADAELDKAMLKELAEGNF
jgi:hypothetical protein